MAIGNPLGLQSSVTGGIVSAIGRRVSEPGGAALPGVIQTSVAINPGNSGGALVDLSGQVVGIPTFAATDPQLGGSAPGIGFGGGGVLVYHVVAGGPAARAGIQPGDVITAISGQSTSGATGLSTVLANLKPSNSVGVHLVRQDGSGEPLAWS